MPQNFVIDSKQTVAQQLESALAHIKNLEAEAQTAEELIAKSSNFEKENTDLKQEVESLKESVKAKDVEISALKAEVETVKQSVEIKTAVRAQEIMSSLGVPPIQAKPSGQHEEVKSQEDLWKEYHAITDPKAKTLFYRKHLKSK